jgi:hypothetical protein
MRRETWAVRLAATQCAGAAAVIVAVTALPWTRYRLTGFDSKTLPAGSLGNVLIALAAGSVVLAVMAALTARRTLLILNTGLGAATAIITVIDAGRRISHANTLTESGGGSTVFGLGTAVALVGAVVVIAAAVVCLDRTGEGRV